MDVNQKPLQFEVDTGAAVTVISDKAYKAAFPGVELSKSDALLRTYTGELMTVLGELRNVTVQYKDQCVKGLPLIVVKGTGASLLGHNWLKKVRLDWSEIRAITTPGVLNSMLSEYKEIFSEGLGTIDGFKAKFHVSESAQPKFHKARTVPFAIREAVEEELDRLERIGVIEKSTTVIGLLR